MVVRGAGLRPHATVYCVLVLPEVGGGASGLHLAQRVLTSRHRRRPSSEALIDVLLDLLLLLVVIVVATRSSFAGEGRDVRGKGCAREREQGVGQR